MRKKKTKGKKRTKSAKRKEKTPRKEKLPRQDKTPGKKLDAPQLEVGELFDRVVAIMDGARDRVVRRVNHEMLIAYWHIGREIVEQVQEGEGRAAYGRQVLKALSKRLTERYGRGFSFTNLSYFRLFYKAYETRRPGIEAVSGGGSVAGEPDPIHHTVCDELGPVTQVWISRSMVQRSGPRMPGSVDVNMVLIKR